MMCTGLGDITDIVTLEDQLVLLGFRFGDDNSAQHVDVSYSLLK